MPASAATLPGRRPRPAGRPPLGGRPQLPTRAPNQRRHNFPDRTLSTLSQTVHTHNLFCASQLSEGLPGSIPAVWRAKWERSACHDTHPLAPAGRERKQPSTGQKYNRFAGVVEGLAGGSLRSVAGPPAVEGPWGAGALVGWSSVAGPSGGDTAIASTRLARSPSPSFRQKPIEVEPFGLRHPTDDDSLRLPGRARLVRSGGQHNGSIQRDRELVNPNAHTQRFEQPPDMAFFGPSSAVAGQRPQGRHRLWECQGPLDGVVETTPIPWHFNHRTPQNPADIRQLGCRGPPEPWGAPIHPSGRRGARRRRGRPDECAHGLARLGLKIALGGRPNAGQPRLDTSGPARLLAPTNGGPGSARAVVVRMALECGAGRPLGWGPGPGPPPPTRHGPHARPGPHPPPWP